MDAADAMRLLEYKGLLNDANDRADRLDVEPTDELAAIARRGWDTLPDARRAAYVEMRDESRAEFDEHAAAYDEKVVELGEPTGEGARYDESWEWLDDHVSAADAEQPEQGSQTSIMGGTSQRKARGKAVAIAAGNVEDDDDRVQCTICHGMVDIFEDDAEHPSGAGQGRPVPPIESLRKVELFYALRFLFFFSTPANSTSSSKLKSTAVTLFMMNFLSKSRAAR